MARLQLLLLPPYNVDGEQPFAVVIDGLTAEEAELLDGHAQSFKEGLGAKSVLAFSFALDID